MKKKLLILICVFANFIVSAQCVPDSQFTAPGIYPDTALGLDDAIVGQPYNQVITIITPLDTSVEYNGIPIPVTIEYIELTSFSGLPPNFAYDCLAPNCIFDGGSTSCAVLYSTSDPTSADIGSYQLIMTTTTSADAGLGIPITQDDIIEKLDSLDCLEVPLIGVPSGVKMYSGCFAEDTLAAAEVLAAWINGDLGFSTTEVLDMDEESYRLGEWKIDMFGQAITPASPLWIQGSKHQVQAVGEDEVLESLSEHIMELYVENENCLIVWGAGGSLNKIAKLCHLETTLLGIDISKGNELIGADLSEKELISILENFSGNEIVLLLSPMGGQGFLIGRGNLQLSPDVLRKIGIDNIMGVATPAKLLSISRIRIDTGDTLLDKEIRGKKYIKMIQGYRTIKIVKIESPNN